MKLNISPEYSIKFIQKECNFRMTHQNKQADCSKSSQKNPTFNQNLYQSIKESDKS